MYITLHERSLITIPKDIINKLGLKTNDQFEIAEENGVISLIPVKVYKKNYIDSIRDEMCLLKEESVDYVVSSKISDIMEKLD